MDGETPCEPPICLRHCANLLSICIQALLRQPAYVSRKEKLAYVNEVIKLLDMDEYADAVVGIPGEGLNVEQRKRVTVGVELAAKPELLLFLDEPTSGLDSQTSWAICDLMGKSSEKACRETKIDRCLRCSFSSASSGGVKLLRW